MSLLNQTLSIQEENRHTHEKRSCRDCTLFLYLMEIDVLTLFAMMVKIISSAESVNYKTVSL